MPVTQENGEIRRVFGSRIHLEDALRAHSTRLAQATRRAYTPCRTDLKGKPHFHGRLALQKLISGLLDLSLKPYSG